MLHTRKNRRWVAVAWGIVAILALPGQLYAYYVNHNNTEVLTISYAMIAFDLAIIGALMYDLRQLRNKAKVMKAKLLVLEVLKEVFDTKHEQRAMDIETVSKLFKEEK